MGWRGGLPRVIDVEGHVVNSADGETFLRFRKDSGDMWRVCEVLFPDLRLNRPSQTTYPEDRAPDIQASGRLSLILSSRTPLLFVIPDEDDLALSYALRLAHDLDTFHKLDAEVLTDAEACGLLESESLGSSNMVILDGPKKTSFGRRLLKGPNHPLFPPRVCRSRVKSNGTGLLGSTDRRLISTTAAIFLHRHPTHPDAATLFLRADDEIGMENVLRLFPIRTGVFGPDWMVVGSETAMLGAAGITGAG